MKDYFRPSTEPACRIYDAFQHESTKRRGRSVSEWATAELTAVWMVARDLAQAHGRSAPTLDQIARVERFSRGHVDYGAKWAYGVAELLRTPDAAAAG